MSTNRREFLKQSGLALAGWAGVSGLAAAAEATPTSKSAAPLSGGADSVERWLLETGRHKIDDGIYRAIANGKL